MSSRASPSARTSTAISSSTGVRIVVDDDRLGGSPIGRTIATTRSGTSASTSARHDHEPAVECAVPAVSGQRAGEVARRGSGRAAGSRRRAGSRRGTPGMMKRKKLPDETVDSGVVPLTTRNVPNQVASSPAIGNERRATPRVPAIGAHSSRRALQKYSRRLLALSCRLRPVEVDVPVDVGHAAATIAPAASRVSSSANAGSDPSPRSFHTARVSNAAAARARTGATAAGCARAARRRTARRRKDRSKASRPPRSRPPAPRRCRRAGRGSRARA